MSSLVKKAAALLPLFLLSSCVGVNDPYPYDTRHDSYYDDYSDRDYWREREREKDREERKRLEREREHLEHERRDADEEAARRRHREEERRREEQREDSRRKPPVAESCPRGYTPSEKKCTPEERKRGCKDVRLDSGLGCVKR